MRKTFTHLSNQNTVVPYYVPGGAPTPAVTPTLADFNGDGKLDMLVPIQNSSDGSIELTDYLGIGNGTFTPGPIIYSTKSLYNSQYLVGDLNGDGKLDLVALNGTTASIYLGDGKGGFQPASTIDLSMGQDVVGNTIYPSNVALGDFNGDGKLDLAVAYYDYYSPQNVVKIYPGDGTGHFGPPQTVTVGDNPFTLVSVPRAPFLDVGTFAVTDHGPTAENAAPTVFAGSSVSIPVLDNASNPDKVPLTICQVNAPAHGTAHVFADSFDPADAVIVYTANPGFSGSDSFTYTIQDPAGVQSTATATVTVLPALSAPVLQFSSANYNVDASSNYAVITVTRTSTASIPVAVQYATSDGTASDGYDYTAVSGKLTFNANDTSTSFDIPILNTGQFDSGLTVNIALSDPTGGAVLGTQNTAVLTIANSPSPLPPPPPPFSPPSSPLSWPPTPIFNAPPPYQPPALHTPPLLAFFDTILGGIETVLPYESEIVTDDFLGFHLLLSIYDVSGNLKSVTFFGINVTFLFA